MHHSPKLAVILIAAIVLSLAALPASATLFVRVADDDLARQSDVIAEVIVRSVEKTTAERPRTAWRLDVVDLVAGELAGDAASNALEVSLPGGVTAEGHELRLLGLPHLAPGDRALVFLAPGAAEGTYRLKHLMQGLFFVDELAGSTLAFRPFVGATEISLPEKSIEDETPRDLVRFKAWLRDLKAGQQRQVDYKVREPEAIAAWVRENSQKFTLFENGGRNLRWPNFDAGSVTWRSHNSGQPGLPSGGHSEFQAAQRAWNNDPSTFIDLRYGGQTGNATGFGDFDGQNVILWNDLAGDISDPFSCASGGTLAIGGPWFTGSGTHTFRGQTFVTILGGDIITNAGIQCWIFFNNRAPEVFAHELGHTLGLGHSCGDGGSGACNTFAKDDALMRAQAHGDGRGARLGSDDRAAINLLYGNLLTPPSAPNNLQASSVSVGIVDLTWNDTANNETGFAIERRRGSGNFQQIASVGSNSQSFRDLTAPSGSQVSYRIRATNGAGDSSFANSQTLSTPGAAPPSDFAVEILSATSARLTWTDNALTEAGFEVFADGFGMFQPVGTAGPDANEVVIDGLWPNIDYDFRLRSSGDATGKSSFVEASGITLAGAPEPCVQDRYTLCLNGGRFRAQVAWRDFDEGIGGGSRLEVPVADSGLYWFFNPDNLEMLVKVLNGCGFNGHYWVFAAATTNVEFGLVVGDTMTGAVSVHMNELGVSAPAITDIEALAVCPGSDESPVLGEPETVVRTMSMSDPSIQMPAVESLHIEAPVEKAGADLGELLKADCVADDGTLCLNESRFQVRATWRDFDDNTGPAQVVDLPVVADDSGLLWFFAPSNWEVLLKVLNGCGFNDRYWVFSAATTNVEYRIEVTDTVAGQTRVYTNALGVTASAVTDTDAFATCP